MAMRGKFRLKLVHLVGAITILSLCLGTWRAIANPYYTQFAAAVRLGRLGCQFRIEPATTSWHRYLVPTKLFVKVVGMSAQKSTLTDSEMVDIPFLRHLRQLNLDSTPITNAGLAHVAKLNELNELSLSNTPVTDDGMTQLTNLRNLNVLRIDRTRVTDEGMTSVAALKSLRTLKLSERVTIGGLKRLYALTNLKLLDASRTFIADADIESLGSPFGCRVVSPKAKSIILGVAPSLSSQQLTPEQWQQTWKLFETANRLKIDFCNLRDEDLEGIESVTKLITLEIKGSFLTDQGLARISRLTNLHRFVLKGEKATPSYGANPDVSDKGLEQLGKLTNVRYLGLMNLPIHGEFFPKLSGLVQLRILDLSGSNIQDEHLDCIVQFPGLRSLDLRRTPVSKKCIEKLREKRPQLTIYSD